MWACVACVAAAHDAMPVDSVGLASGDMVVDSVAQDTLVRTRPVADRHVRQAVTLEQPETKLDSVTTPTMGKVRAFNPDPVRATWLSALCPGLGQIYNRRYWKLPIVVGAFVGLSYGTAWNNRMFHDYQRGYRDAMDNDPDTRSYMNFFPRTTQESKLDKTWLQNVLKRKRDYYRRYRDICIAAMVGVYILNIVDAYVDASLSHFDISPDLSMDVAPAMLEQPTGKRPTLGLQCAINF